MALRLNKYSMPATREHPDRDLIRERSRRKPNRRFFPQHSGHTRFEFLHHTAARVVVDRNLACGRQGREKPRILGGRMRNAVAKCETRVVADVALSWKAVPSGAARKLRRSM